MRKGLFGLALLCLAAMASPAAAQGGARLEPQARELIGSGDLGLGAARATLQVVLETGRPGESHRWEDPQGRDHGLVVPEFEHQDATGRVCRDYLRTLVRGGQRRALEGTACRQGPGRWAVVGERPIEEAAPAAAPEPDPVDQEAARLREIQTLLATLGFDPGPVDGIMGRQTRAAIQAFREAAGLAADGAADDALLLRLRQERIAMTRRDPEAFPPFVVSSPAPPPELR